MIELLGELLTVCGRRSANGDTAFAPMSANNIAYVLCIHGNFLIAPLGLLNGANIRACYVIFARRQCGDILR